MFITLKPDRDPRGHTITVAYIAKGNMDNKKADSDACEIGIFTQKDLVNIRTCFRPCKNY